MIRRVATMCWVPVLSCFLVSAAAAQSNARAPLQFQGAYSNTDGSIQFVVLSIVQGEVPLTGQTLIADDGAGMLHSYTFTSEVPDRTPGKLILIATQGFADLGRVRPDFVVPNGFLSPWGGRLRLDTVLLARLQGFCHLDAGETFSCGEFHVATNNAGEWTVLGGDRAGSFGGLWWNSPPGSEPGWAVAIEQQGSVVVAVWLTYATDGSPTWFVMPRGEVALDGAGHPDPYTYAGRIYRMQGPPLGAVPYAAERVVATEIGSGSLSFGSAMGYWDYYESPPPIDLATFKYSLDGKASTTKYLTRQVFAEPMPVCRIGSDPGGAPNFQGLWWNAAEPGWGLYVAHQGDVVFVLWLTYDASGRATWLTLTAKRTGPNTYAGALRRTTGPAFDAATFDPAVVSLSEVGTGSLIFAGAHSGLLSFSFDGFEKTTGITRQIFAQPVAVCH